MLGDATLACFFSFFFGCDGYIIKSLCVTALSVVVSSCVVASSGSYVSPCAAATALPFLCVTTSSGVVSTDACITLTGMLQKTTI